MGKIKRYKKKAGRFLKSDSGQRFFNFAYSIGAAIVILGALFKILHMPLGNLLLSVGMGTEVLMFVLTAFDKPEKEYHWEEVFPLLASQDPEDRPDFNTGGGIFIGGAGGSGNGEGYEGGEINVSVTDAKNAVGLPQGVNLSEEDTLSLSESIAKMAAASDQLSRMAELTDATQQYLSQMAGISEQMQKLQATTTALNEVSETLLGSYRAITDNSQNITESSTGYVDQMQALNHNISGLNTIYEIQLKSISSQLENIDRVNRGLKDIRDMYEKSAAESVYEKMIKAMTVNMYRPMPGMPGIEPDSNDQDA